MPLEWMKKKTNVRQRADSGDKAKAKRSSGEYRVTSNSGAGKSKMDLVGEVDCIETKFTDKKSFSLKCVDIRKMMFQSTKTFKQGKRLWPGMHITMQDEHGPLKVIVIEEHIYDLLRATYIESNAKV
jgi:hypothetical protein